MSSKVRAADAQSSGTSEPQTPGVSVSFLRFVDSGPAKVSYHRATIRPTTNQSIFGPRTSRVTPTNITITNVVTGGPAAIFQYTNSSPFPTFVAVQSIEYSAGTIWKAVALPPEAKTMVLVPATSAVIQIIPVTATDVSWRITAFCIEQAKGVPRAVERAKELGQKALTGQKTEHFSGRKYLIKTNPPATK